MATLFITSFFLLGIIIFALYLKQHASSSDESSAGHALPPQRHFDGLFGGGPGSIGRELTEKKWQAPETEEALRRRAQLLSRAAEGDRETLEEAHKSGDEQLYEDVLHALVQAAAGSGARLLALASYITRTEHLRVNRQLAEGLMENWRESPSRASTAKMLHLVALADDPALYERAVETVARFWREGRISDLTAAELRTLIDGEYWVLSNKSRSSGAGFVLKRRLARLRRELESATRQ